MISWIDRLLDIIFPRYCCICEEFLSNSELSYICPRCADKICLLRGHLCEHCGHLLNANQICPRCAIYHYHFKQLRSAVRLNPYSRKLIHLLKYKNQTHIAKDMAKIMLKNPDFAQFIDHGILVPVPLHWKRQFFREYNQSAILISALTQLNLKNITTLPLLKKLHSTRPQVGLNALERQTNVAHSFGINLKIQIDKSCKIIVFDDVFTTGATINECCRVLKEHQFVNVFAATFAQTIRTSPRG